MSGRFRRYAPALVLTIGALAIAGCGGSSGSSGTNGGSASGPTLTPKQWQTKMQAISSELTAAFQPVKTEGSNPQTWFTLAATLKHINSEVAAIKPPAVATDVNAAIASGLAPLPDESTAIGNDLKNQDQAAAKKDALALQRSLFALLRDISTALLKVHGGGGTTT
ncbi:MAG: hypothetical protein ACJ764_11250 [Solirubrobacteraceae bacterium]